MKHWNLLGEAPIPASRKILSLYEGKDDFYIRITGGVELMNTRKHGSEDALGALPCQRLAGRANVRMLIGGLGMGFTLAAALANRGEDAEVTVAELIPEVVLWNQGPLGARSGYPLRDPRARVHVGDVALLLRKPGPSWDIIALDVDNGPEGLTQRSNDWLYSDTGVAAAQRTLRPGGVLAYWSAGPAPAFQDQLRRSGWQVDEIYVHAHGNKGARHTIWLARNI